MKKRGVIGWKRSCLAMTHNVGYEKGKNTKFKNRKRFFTFLYPLLYTVFCGWEIINLKNKKNKNEKSNSRKTRSKIE